jgi:hypothetical protein
MRNLWTLFFSAPRAEDPMRLCENSCKGKSMADKALDVGSFGGHGG